MESSNRGTESRDTYKKEHKKAGYDIMTVMSTVIAFLILTAAVSIVFILVIKQTSAKKINNANSNIVQGEETGDSDDTDDGTEAKADAVEAVETNTETPVIEQSVGTLTIINDVNIRDNPDTDNSNVIKVAKASETYEYLGMADYDNWYIILLEDGTRGYVYKGYVSTN